MIERSCRACLFYDRCTHRSECDNFAPVEDIEDNELYTYVEDQRIEFYREWYQYTSEDFE